MRDTNLTSLNSKVIKESDNTEDKVNASDIDWESETYVAN